MSELMENNSKGGYILSGPLLRDYVAMKAVLEQISEGLSLASLGLPVLPSGAGQSEFLHQERTIGERVQEMARETVAGLEAEETLPRGLRWVAHDETFSSLMLGRIEVAQVCRGNPSSNRDYGLLLALQADVCQGNPSSNWFYTLRFCKSFERSCFAEPTEAAAKAVCEDHARAILA
jgi:hypothetical protein